ncbi:hypothetical protein [Parolsenella catena]|uniref:hypothetical protein n=2 Tax=Parolsenella catena TaxID=2003188 RepID=UPI002FDCA8F5
MAKTLAALHPAWVFSHQTAALFYGLSVSYSCLGKVHYTTPCRAGGQDKGYTCHHQAKAAEWRMIDGVRVSSSERMLYDCLRSLPFADALVIADGALREGVSTREKLERYLGWHAGGRGIRYVRQVLESADGRAESGAESIARATVISLGVPIYDLQLVVADLERPGKTYRLDIVLRRSDDTLVDLEVDGRQKYELLNGPDGAVTAMMAERQREAAITAHGILVARIAAADAGNRPVMERKLRAYGVIPKPLAVAENETWDNFAIANCGFAHRFVPIFILGEDDGG